MKENAENQYLKIMQDIRLGGIVRQDRTGIGTKSIFGPTIKHDFSFGFPLLTTKKVHIKSIIYELLWIIKGDTNIKYLQNNGVTIWNEWADENGDLGPVYGAQLRNFNGADQLRMTLEALKKNPWSRRHVISLWNAADLDKQALHCCHGTVIQFYVRQFKNELVLDMATYQRSADWFLGVPFNIASYSFFLYMICDVLGYKPGKLIYHFGDAHLYLNHEKQIEEQLKRKCFDLPTLKLNHRNDIEDFVYKDFMIENYKHHPAIKAPVAI